MNLQGLLFHRRLYSMHAGMYVMEDKSNWVQQGASEASPTACIIRAKILVASIIVKMR